TPPLRLHGETLELLSIELNGQALGPKAYAVDAEGLTVHEVPAAFTLTTQVRLKPQENFSLSGLYRTSGNFCTQCEAHGFRRITYFLDRPDVMATYRTTIVADTQRYPVLLGNGNKVDEGRLADGRAWVTWADPFPKPSYLFALVAGNLACHSGTFTTKSGREVELEIWVEPQNIDKCEHALRSLQKSMRWDEETFGLEYDLDIYMIVAVNDFNMGAMENKGLNVFNSKYVLARPDTATDQDYEAIEAVIGHEYFHNWTGNRVTCRDWFQLTLKEGLTVYRDQRFTADMTSAAVKRIKDVQGLRVRQFLEDAGPMAHPVRPESYVSMDNFYTATVYQKGAEVVRMYETLLGRKGFRRGMDLYFERHDGEAVTCDDFRAAMADANKADLEQFGRWYQTPGTPQVAVEDRWDAAAGRYTLTLTQSLSERASAIPADQRELHIPIAVGLLGRDGGALPLRIEGQGVRVQGDTAVLELRQATQAFSFTGLSERPIPSVLRGFSAPVKLSFPRERADLAFLMAHDTDTFSRWDAGQTLAQALLLDGVASGGRDLDPLFVEAWGKVLADPELDGSLKGLALALPAEVELAQAMEVIDVDAIHEVRQAARRQLALAHREALEATYERLADCGPYSNDATSIANRRLKNTCLAFLSTLEDPEITKKVARQFAEADNMTDAQTALALLTCLDVPQRAEALSAFYARWKDDPLVLDKWFTLQATSSLPSTPAEVAALREHEAFDLKNPNRVRALVGAFATANQVRFHAADGRGYRLLGDTVLALDAMNPQGASRMARVFNEFKRFDAGRQALQREQLERIAAAPGLSKDTGEIVSRALA
ncbi:MAG: aminopeptidase N, partial [Planctomycetes bacterium]|nr:aminopeptidase N [Planctomycetota bacterium]